MTTFDYNGLGDRTRKLVDYFLEGYETQYTLDVAGGLPHVIVETTDEQTSRYLTGLAQQQDTTWAYQHPDGLGSVRQLTDASAEVTLLQSYDPFGNLVAQSGPGSSGFGYTGEQEDANTGLVFLRARYYDPSTGRFVSRDPFSGYLQRPQTQNLYAYVTNNPVNYLDPTGFSRTPRRPTQDEWTETGAFEWEYSQPALDRLISLRRDVVAAAQRHGFIPKEICSAAASQNQLMFALAAIVYRESLGYDKERQISLAYSQDGQVDPKGTLKSVLEGVFSVPSAIMGIPIDEKAKLYINFQSGAPATVGIGQMRPTTALALEQAGLVYTPRSTDGRWIYIDPVPFEAPSMTMIFHDGGGGIAIPYAHQVARLSSPPWAIEYTAANMENARSKPGYYEPQIPGQLTPEWERMAAWYNRGVVNLNRVEENRRLEIWKDLSESYLPGTWKVMQVIERFDLLGVRLACDDSCGNRPGSIIVAPN